MLAIHDMTATELLTHYKDGTLTPVEVIEHTLARAEQKNQTLNALYYLEPHTALEEAKASTQRWKKRKPKGRLDGIPTTAKDGLSTKGMPMYRGTAASPRYPAPDESDCPAIARMREEGAIVIGKTTMCDFGILPAGYSSRFGPTRNPANPFFNTGGSSSGTAACVAAGIGPIAVGTDIVGSIRLPASFCGIYGLKPSQGRVPYHYPNSPYLVAGPMTRTVEDAALLLDVITRPDARDFTSLPWPGLFYAKDLEARPASPRVGYIGHLDLGMQTNDEVQNLMDSALDSFRQAGIAVTELPSPFNPEDAREAELFFKVRCLAELEKLPLQQQKQAGLIYDWTRDAVFKSASELYTAYLHLQTIAERALKLFGTFDYLLLPTVPTPAYPAEMPAERMDELFAPWAHTFPFNISGQPAASINCGYTPVGLPVGLQIVGKPQDDLGVLQMSRLFEAFHNAVPTESAASNKKNETESLEKALQ